MAFNSRANSLKKKNPNQIKHLSTPHQSGVDAFCASTTPCLPN